MPDTQKNQADGSELERLDASLRHCHAPVWRVVASAQPKPEKDGGVTIRMINHMGHTIDLYIPRKLWQWTANFSQSSSSSIGSSVIPAVDKAAGVSPQKLS